MEAFKQNKLTTDEFARACSPIPLKLPKDIAVHYSSNAYINDEFENQANGAQAVCFDSVNSFTPNPEYSAMTGYVSELRETFDWQIRLALLSATLVDEDGREIGTVKDIIVEGADLNSKRVLMPALKLVMKQSTPKIRLVKAKEKKNGKPNSRNTGS